MHSPLGRPPGSYKALRKILLSAFQQLYFNFFQRKSGINLDIITPMDLL